MKHAGEAIRHLKVDTDFADVTLASEDGKQMMAHKVILSAFSPVFRTLLKNMSQREHNTIYFFDMVNKRGIVKYD